ncbi:MAG TPA: histidine kinase [Rectinemataceae bacterium]
MAKQGRRPRIGIRGKLLAFLGAAILAILALELLAQSATRKVSAEYETYLSHYHLVHRMRISLGEFRATVERYLREPASIAPEGLYESLAALSVLCQELQPLGELSVDAGFETAATAYGMDAYRPLVSRSVSFRASGRSDYYADFAKSERIAGYMDSYLSKLLGILMRQGGARFEAASRRSASLARAIFFGMALAAILLLGYVYLVSNSITRPIRSLAAASEKLARGELDLGAEPIRSRDEVGILAERFYAMSASIGAYVKSLEEKADLEKKLREEETSLLAMGKALREAQFMNLQDQIRPHFLFNALNSIARTALLEGARTTEALTISLAKLLRATMKEGGAFVPLSEEIDIVREYLGFQKARFGSRLDWEIEAEASLGRMKIPRFLLQPLVENAVRHGIEPKEEGGTVKVVVRRRGSKLKAYVLDTGVGMDPLVLGRLRSSFLQGVESVEEKSEARLSGSSGIGMANLASRLGLLYGSSSSMGVVSYRGKGSLVWISLPLDEA